MPLAYSFSAFLFLSLFPSLSLTLFLSLCLCLSLSLSFPPLPPSPEPRLCLPPQVPSVSDWQLPTPRSWGFPGRAWGSQPERCLLNKEKVPLGAWELSPLPSLSLHTLGGISESIITLRSRLVTVPPGAGSQVDCGSGRSEPRDHEERNHRLAPPPGRSCLLISCSLE